MMKIRVVLVGQGLAVVVAAVVVVFSMVCRCAAAQATGELCRYTIESTTSKVFGLCQKTVSFTDEATGCYWFQKIPNVEGERPFVGALQLVAIPSSNGNDSYYAALCLLERQIPGLRPNHVFTVSFGPQYTKRYPVDNFVVPNGFLSDVSDPTGSATTGGPRGRRLPDPTPAVSKEVTTSSPNDVIYVVVGLLATAAAIAVALNVAYVIRRRQKAQTTPKQIVPSTTNGPTTSIEAVRPSDIPDSAFFLPNASSDSIATRTPRSSPAPPPSSPPPSPPPPPPPPTQSAALQGLQTRTVRFDEPPASRDPGPVCLPRVHARCDGSATAVQAQEERPVSEGHGGAHRATDSSDIPAAGQGYITARESDVLY